MVVMRNSLGAEPSRRYRAFISYSQKDKAYARRLQKALENFRLPHGVESDGAGVKARRLGRFFRDDDEMGAAADLGEALRGAIADSESLIVVCSPNAAQSRWVNEEVLHFKRTGRADRIFALIVGGAPNPPPHQPERECFPPALRFALDVDGRLTSQPAEPLGLDIRKEPFDRLVVRIAAGLVRAPFDQLWKREQRRRRITTLMVSTAALAGGLLLAGAITQTLWLPAFERYWRYEQHAHSNAEMASAPAGVTFQDCRAGSTDCPTMVVIPEGDLVVGSASNYYFGGCTPPRACRGVQAGPNRRHSSVVHVPRLAVSETEITFDHWEACVRGGGCRWPTGPIIPADGGWGRGNRPVVGLQWSEVQLYLQWLSRVTSANYRLLTQAEWEYAARGIANQNDTRVGAFWSFDNHREIEEMLGEFAWYADNSDGQTHPVASKRANDFGLFDMHGNVTEWVDDGQFDYDRSPIGYRSIRGGSWRDDWGGMVPWLNQSAPEALRSVDIGFRVVREL